MFRTTISDQDRNLVMTVREIVQSEIAPYAVKWDAQGTESFEWTAVDLLAEQNLLAPCAPEKYGGRGLSTLSTAMILEEIAAGCAGVAACVASNLHSIIPLLIAGTEEQRQEFIPQLTQKKARLGAVPIMDHKPNLEIIAHPETLDIRGSSLKAAKGENHQVLNGLKEYVMNGQVASFLTTLYSSPEGSGKGLQIVVLPMLTPGIKMGKIRTRFGLRYCSSSDLIFEDVCVDNKYLVGKPGTGFIIFMQGLERMATFIAAISVGTARAAYETALDTARKRMVGKPSFEETGASLALVNMANKLNAARLSVHQACWLIDHDMDCSQASSKAKIIASRYSQEITGAAMEIIGETAYLRGYPCEKYLRDAKLLSFIDGSEMFHKSLIAAQL